ncbi:hypothetical protein CA13_09890 [Planctomycetes bacterium CA13]|uniref:Uncharacterized protein n=1 Tax=Novipirellula herctigrandis TaxID=2527986 RepID=A0A5C5YX39_9BACT|nr:hypothetical protein CA13_09890 [Planctomycetes bacterium CA13]
MSPKHSIDFCPICGGGLCGVRICGLNANDETNELVGHYELVKPHGLIVCDECEAIWLEPDTSTPHQYPDACDARCPICSEPLWGKQSRWADLRDIAELGWTGCTNPELDVYPDEGLV